MANIVDKFRTMLAGRGITLTEKMADQFETYFHELVSWNNKMNLTAITEREDVYMNISMIPLPLHFFSIWKELTEWQMSVLALGFRVCL